MRNFTVMDSQKLGALFEKASINIFTHLFESWEYKVLEYRSQKSGIQFGFDLFFKIKKSTYPINIFIECKASKTDNEIPIQELVEKSSQLNWANFPNKDIHICFSPTREVKLSNLHLSLVDATKNFPFIVIDWTRKNNDYSKLLFLSYYGEDLDILAFKDFLLKSDKIDTKNQSSIKFDDLSEIFLENFHDAIDENINLKTSNSFDFINSVYWEKIIDNSDKKIRNLYQFYIKTDSNSNRIKQIVANHLNIKNKDAHKQIRKSFDEFSTSENINTIFIKITSAGGTGKSTFLYDLAKKWYLTFNTFILNEPLEEKEFKELEKIISFSQKKKPILLLIDNFLLFAEDNNWSIKRLGEWISSKSNKKIILLAFERKIRLNTLENLTAFQSFFDKIHQIHYGFKYDKKKKIFNKIIEILDLKVTDEKLSQLRKRYLTQNSSISESTFGLLKYIDEEKLKLNYRHDWEDWNYYVKSTDDKRLKNLYLLVSTFYQFGLWLTIEFCSAFLKIDDFELVNILDYDKSLPIYSYGNRVYLRHETLANWYFENSSTNRKASIYIFEKFLKSINSTFEIQLFIRVCRNKEFEKSFLGSYLNEGLKIKILTHYIHNVDEDAFVILFLAGLYRRNLQFEEAVKYLKKIEQTDKNNFHLNLELSKLYSKKEEFEKAQIYAETAISNSNTVSNFDKSQAYYELGKTFLFQKEITKAVDNFKLATKYFRNNIYAGRDLGRVYLKSPNKKVRQVGLEIYNRLLEVDENNLELRIDFIRGLIEAKKINKAEDTLLFSPNTIHTFRITRKMFFDYYEKKEMEIHGIALMNRILDKTRNTILDDEKAFILNLKGDLFKKIEYLDQSIGCYEKSNSLKVSAYAISQLGYLYLKKVNIQKHWSTI